MKVLTEAQLRSALLPSDISEYHVSPDTLVTSSAREYLQLRSIKLVVEEQKACCAGQKQYYNALTGEKYDVKPESFTHLFGNALVSKSHPRIALRGLLDGLQAEILVLQSRADAAGKTALSLDLSELLSCARQVLGAEVKGEPLPEQRLLGFDARELREHSHNVSELLGVKGQPLPAASMGEFACGLNLLRTKVREAELSAVRAFENGGCEGEREDLIIALNRMSSAVHIMFCRELAGKYKS